MLVLFFIFYSRSFFFLLHWRCPSVQPSFMSAVSDVSSRKMIPVFCRSRPAE